MHSLAFTQPTFSSRPHMPLLFYSFPCFLPTTVTLPPSFSSYDLFLAPFHSVSCPRSLSPPSFLCGSIFHHRLSAACPRARDKKKAIQVAGIGVRPRPGFEFNYSSPHYTGERDENYASTIIFSRELSLPLYRRLNAPLDCVPRAHLCGPYARTGITSRFLCLSLSLRFIPFHFTMYIYLDIAGEEEEVIRLNSGLN